jgi:hypothetical protein
VRAGLVVGRTWRERKRPEVVIEGVILLHDDYDVIDLAQIAFGAKGMRDQQGERRESCQE